jgi:hypothetical protein
MKHGLWLAFLLAGCAGMGTWTHDMRYDRAAAVRGRADATVSVQLKGDDFRVQVRGNTAAQSHITTSGEARTEQTHRPPAWRNPLLWVGVLGVAGGVIAIVWLRWWKMGLGVAGSGLAVCGLAVASTEAPWVLWGGLGVAGVVVGIVLLVAWWSRRQNEALRTVVRGIDRAPVEYQCGVKTHIKRASLHPDPQRPHHADVRHRRRVQAMIDRELQDADSEKTG